MVRLAPGGKPWEWPVDKLHWLSENRLKKSRELFLRDGCRSTQHREIRMTVKKINRSHRMVYAAGLFVLAVILTTVLVLAGEGNAQSQKKSVFQRSLRSTYSTAMDKRGWVCAVA